MSKTNFYVFSYDKTILKFFLQVSDFSWLYSRDETIHRGFDFVRFVLLVGTRGVKSRKCPPYPHACRKRRLKWGAVI